MKKKAYLLLYTGSRSVRTYHQTPSGIAIPVSGSTREIFDKANNDLFPQLNHAIPQLDHLPKFRLSPSCTLFLILGLPKQRQEVLPKHVMTFSVGSAWPVHAPLPSPSLF